MMFRYSTAQLIDQMPDVVLQARSVKARRFAEDMCRKSIRPGWRPTPGQRRYMGFCVAALTEKEDEDFDVFEAVHD